MKRKIITQLMGALAVFVFMPMSVSADCVGDVTGKIFKCGDVVTESCTFTADMFCPSTPTDCCEPGLIVGAPDITINGAGYKLVGNCPLEDCCPVLVDVTNGEPVGQPCRVAALGSGTGLYSGIYNAVDKRAGGSPTGGCVPSGVIGVVGQYGCDGLTVKNLEITGFCDGIFASGTIGSNPDDPATHDLVEGQEFYHNVIHHNGYDCDTCFNDAIFTALLGVADSNYPNSSQSPINKPGDYTCTVDVVEGIEVIEGNTSVISNNNIWSQKGWGIEGGPGGNGINLQGGMEYDIGETNPIRYSSCVEVHNNAIMKVRLSGIMLTHALEGVKMYKNDIEYAEYGGITIPCDFVKYNTIKHNVIIKCAGVGIGVFEGTHITGNVVKDTVRGLAHFTAMGFPNSGDGILINSGDAGKVGNTSDLQDNTSCFSYDKDIKVFGGTVIYCGDNQCCKTNAESCHRWNCPCFGPDDNCNDPGTGGAGWSDWKNCMASDINNDGAVTGADAAIMSGSWNQICTETW